MPTKIEWCEESWNPATGCTPVSEGCANCYAANIAKRFWGDRKFSDVRFHIDRLDKPLKWRKPRRIFVVSMGDLFHDDVEWNWQYKIFEIMFINPDHVYIVLTKRPERMKKVLPDIWFHLGRNYGIIKGITGGYPFPIKNLWLGVTCEDQKTADERIPILLDIPAAVRFVSCEPLLSNINLFHRNMLDWVICGTESGPKRRSAKIGWIRNLRDQCVDFDIPFFLKQMEINGKVKKMPELDGTIYNKYPRS